MRLGEIIHEYRKEHGLSMMEFAERAGFSKAYVGVLEKGIHPNSGRHIAPSLLIIKKAAAAMRMDFDELFATLDEEIIIRPENKRGKSYAEIIKERKKVIPVLGRVAAGIPSDAIENIVDYEDITELALTGRRFFALQIHGDSMEPRICDGDVVIVHQIPSAESGDIVIARTSLEEVACKKLVKTENYTLLRSFNPAYEDIDVTNNEEFQILGVVVELRGKFKKI